jgi:hypothetical protein
MLHASTAAAVLSPDLRLELVLTPPPLCPCTAATPLLIGVGACEVVRLGAMAILSRIHGKENLSSL